MSDSRKRWGLVVVGAVAAVTLGAIAVASAATTQPASPSPAASAQADGRSGDPAHTPDFDGDGPHGSGNEGARGGFGHGGGAPDMAEALARLSGKDVAVIMAERAAGKTFAQIAEAEGVGTGELVAESVAIEKAELDAAVKAGKMTEAQRTQALSGLQARFRQELTETGEMGRGPGDGRGHGFGGEGDIPEALARLSGKDAGVIMEQRAAGKSFAQIAEAYGVGTGELLDETVRIEKAELAAAVKAGTLTEAQRTEILSGLRAHLEEEIGETHALGGHGSGPGGDDTRVPRTPASPSASGTTQSF